LEILCFLWEKWFTFRNENFGMWQEWNMAAVLSVGWLGAQISRARSGKTLWVKWPWLRDPFIASGRWGEGSEEVIDRRRWKFNTGYFGEWRRERSWGGAKLMRGEGRQPGGASLPLLMWGEDWPMERTVRRRRPVQGGDVAWPEEGDNLGGPVLGRKAAHAGRAAGPVWGFWAGWGRRVRWAEKGQNAGRTGHADGLTMKNQKNKNWLMGGLPRLPGRNWFGSRWKIEKGFHILIQGMRFKSKF
jgi:hypothetical protein